MVEQQAELLEELGLIDSEDFNSDGIIFYNELGSIDDLNEELYLSKINSIKDNLERVKLLKSGDDMVYSAIKTIQNARK